MKLASYNVENLFQRARAMNEDTWQDGADVLQMHAEMNRILGKKTYTAADKKRILKLMDKLGIKKKDDGGDWVILRQNRSHLVKRSRSGKVEVVANGRSDWIGWLDLKYEAVNETATRMTAKVIAEIDADVLGVVEAESRPSLLRFCKDVITGVGPCDYEHVMLIDGNDTRGIDVAIMTKAGYEIVGIRSFVDEPDGNERLFSRDCAVYTIVTPQGNRLVVMVNHLKSKGYGTPATSNGKRNRQAAKIKEIYEDLRNAGEKFVAVIGDLNDTPGSAPLAPLAQTDLKDISEHSQFDDGGFPGTYGGSTKSNKIDYLLLSPELMAKVSKGGIFRKGMWPGVRPKKWDQYEEIEVPHHAASDHAAVWATANI
ncbi:MAG: endonuclease/exonuclease/phosphatase family protein [Xanthobacteraceae bacterium]